MEYKEIKKLKQMLEVEKIPFEWGEQMGGYNLAYYGKDNYKVCSVLEHNGSYGHKQDRLEIMGLLTEQEQRIDSVKGWLTADDVFQRIKKHWEE